MLPQILPRRNPAVSRAGVKTRAGTTARAQDCIRSIDTPAGRPYDLKATVEVAPIPSQERFMRKQWLWMLVAVAFAAGPVTADVWDTAVDSDNGNGTDNELVHGAEQVHDLGGAAREHRRRGLVSGQSVALLVHRGAHRRIRRRRQLDDRRPAVGQDGSKRLLGRPGPPVSHDLVPGQAAGVAEHRRDRRTELRPGVRTGLRHRLHHGGPVPRSARGKPPSVSRASTTRERR